MKRKKILIIIFILLIGVVGLMFYLSKGMSSRYEAEVREGLKSGLNQRNKILNIQEIKTLPPLIQKYLHYVGVVGKPIPWNMRLTFEGRMKMDQQKDWMKISSEQYNFFSRPTRMFYIKAKMFGIPFVGLHAYKEEKGTMLIKVLGLLTAVDAKGPEMNQSDTVTLFNDMCIMAPATLIDSRISWEPVDQTSVKAHFTNGENKISAVLYFNKQGELTNFISEDRYMTSNGDNYRKYRWSTPVSDYRDYGGIRLPSRAEAIWNLPEGDFKYGEFRLKDAMYNCSEWKQG